MSDNEGDNKGNAGSKTPTLAPVEEKATKDFRFWMIFVCLLVATFLAALDLTGALIHFYHTAISY